MSPASAAENATSPRGTGTPNRASTALAWYSWIFKTCEAPTGWKSRHPSTRIDCWEFHHGAFMRSRAFSSSIGSKLLIALTGLGLFIFLVGHLSGNLLFIVGPDA